MTRFIAVVSNTLDDSSRFSERDLADLFEQEVLKDPRRIGHLNSQSGLRRVFPGDKTLRDLVQLGEEPLDVFRAEVNGAPDYAPLDKMMQRLASEGFEVLDYETEIDTSERVPKAYVIPHGLI